jgi:hypothetical protein
MINPRYQKPTFWLSFCPDEHEGPVTVHTDLETWSMAAVPTVGHLLVTAKHEAKPGNDGLITRLVRATRSRRFREPVREIASLDLIHTWQLHLERETCWSVLLANYDSGSPLVGRALCQIENMTVDLRPIAGLLMTMDPCSVAISRYFDLPTQSSHLVIQGDQWISFFPNHNSPVIPKREW